MVVLEIRLRGWIAQSPTASPRGAGEKVFFSGLQERHGWLSPRRVPHARPKIVPAHLVWRCLAKAPGEGQDPMTDRGWARIRWPAWWTVDGAFLRGSLQAGVRLETCQAQGGRSLYRAEADTSSL